MHPDKKPKPPHQTPPDQSCYNEQEPELDPLKMDKQIIALAIDSLALINTASRGIVAALEVYFSVSQQERQYLMSTVVEAFAAIDNAVDQVTTDAADEIQRAASQIQILINTNKASDVDASPIINKLLNLSTTLRNTNFQTMVNSDPNLAAATNTQTSQTAPSTSGDNSIPENSSPETNPTTNTQSSTVIGVSDSDNPLASSSPSPLGSQRPIDSTLKPPTDDLTPAAPSTSPDVPTASPSDNSTDAVNAEDSEDNNSDSTTASGNIENG